SVADEDGFSSAGASRGRDEENNRCGRERFATSDGEGCQKRGLSSAECGRGCHRWVSPDEASTVGGAGCHCAGERHQRAETVAAATREAAGSIGDDQASSGSRAGTDAGDRGKV